MNALRIALLLAAAGVATSQVAAQSGPAIQLVGFQQARLDRVEGEIARIFIFRTIDGVRVAEGALSISYELSGDATQGVDYTVTPGAVQFDNGSSQAFLDINVIDDDNVEGTETFFIEMAPGAEYALNGALARLQVVIADNDKAAPPPLGSPVLPTSPADNPAPVITGVSPESGSRGGRELLLSVRGEDFVQASVVHWNGSPVPTTYVSANELRARVARKLLNPKEDNIQVTVVTPAPGGGESGSVSFTFTKN